MKPLGSWVLVADASGRLTRNNENPILVVAMVAVPKELHRTLRTRLIQAFHGKPEKWREGGRSGLERILAIAHKYDLPVLIKTTRVGDRETWATFWRKGEETVKYLETTTGKKVATTSAPMSSRRRCCLLVPLPP